MAQDSGFLARWSQRKSQARQGAELPEAPAPVATPAAAKAPVDAPAPAAPAPQGGFTQPAPGAGNFGQAPTGPAAPDGNTITEPKAQPNSGDDLPF